MLNTAAAQPQTPQLGAARSRRTAASSAPAQGKSCRLSGLNAGCLLQHFSMAAHAGMCLKCHPLFAAESCLKADVRPMQTKLRVQPLKNSRPMRWLQENLHLEGRSCCSKTCRTRPSRCAGVGSPVAHAVIDLSQPSPELQTPCMAERAGAAATPSTGPDIVLDLATPPSSQPEEHHCIS